jgi:hypothetical protein
MDLSGDIYQMFGVDETKKIGGIEIPMGQGVTVTVAKMGNPKFRERWQAITKPYQRQIDNETMDSDELDKLMIQCVAETILVDWKGVKVKGKNFPYSVKNAVTLLTELEEFRDAVIGESRKLANFRAAMLEDSKGN